MADMRTEVDRAIDAAGLDGEARYAAGVELARRYAALLDELGPAGLPEIGPKLLAALDKLGLTVAAKLAKGGEPDAGKPASPLDELRARRRQRAG